MALLLLCLSFSPHLLPLGIWMAKSSLLCCKFQPRSWESLPWTGWSQNILAVTKERMKCETTFHLWSKLNPAQTLNGAKAPSSPGSSLFTCSGSKAFHPVVALLMIVSVMLTGQLPLKSHWCSLCPKRWDEHTNIEGWPFRWAGEGGRWSRPLELEAATQSYSSDINHTKATNQRPQYVAALLCTCLQHSTFDSRALSEQQWLLCTGCMFPALCSSCVMLSLCSERHLLQRRECWCSAYSHILWVCTGKQQSQAGSARCSRVLSPVTKQQMTWIS